MELVKKIDGHVHCDMWNGHELISFYGSRCATPEQVREMYDEHGIEKGVLLPQCTPEEAFSMQSNELAARIVAEHPDTFFWYASIDPRLGYNNPRNNMAYIINHYKHMGAKGVGEITASLPITDPLVDNLFFYAGECDMPVIFHMSPARYGFYGLIDDYGLPGLERAIKKFPKLKFFCHSAMFWSHISSDLDPREINGYPKGKVTPGRVVELFRKYTNVYGDLSAGSGHNALARDPEFAYQFLEEFQDRLMFGTDACNYGDRMELSHWLDEAYLSGGISETVYRKVSRENTIRLLHLDV